MYPDGREVEPEKMESFLEIFDRQFGGCSPLGIIPGRWMSEGKTVKEPMHRIEVGVKKSDIPAFEKVARMIGKETKQKEMYVVINYQAETRFLFVDDEEDESEGRAASR
jgi:hypothetical protein